MAGSDPVYIGTNKHYGYCKSCCLLSGLVDKNGICLACTTAIKITTKLDPSKFCEIPNSGKLIIETPSVKNSINNIKDEVYNTMSGLWFKYSLEDALMKIKSKTNIKTRRSLRSTI